MNLTSKAKILVLYANTYDMINEKQQQLVGCTVNYLFWGEDGKQLLPQSQWNPNEPVGIQRGKCSMDVNLRNKLVIAPALYEGTFEMVVGSDGKAVSKLVDVAYISDVSIRPIPRMPGLVIPGMVETPVEDKDIPFASADKPAAKK